MQAVGEAVEPVGRVDRDGPRRFEGLPRGQRHLARREQLAPAERRSRRADLPLHSTGVLFLHTGSNNAGRPSLGSWVTYGLGSASRNLPGFVVLNFDVIPCGGLENFSAGF